MPCVLKYVTFLPSSNRPDRDGIERGESHAFLFLWKLQYSKGDPVSGPPLPLMSQRLGPWRVKMSPCPGSIKKQFLSNELETGSSHPDVPSSQDTPLSILMRQELEVTFLSSLHLWDSSSWCCSEVFITWIMEFYFSNTIALDSTSLSIKVLTKNRKNNPKWLKGKKWEKEDVYWASSIIFLGLP